MSGGSILAAIGALVALVGANALPFITVDQQEVALRSLHVSTGLLASVLALAVGGLDVAVWRTRKRFLGWIVAGLSLLQVVLLALTYADVWNLVPCQAMGLQACDPKTGGLIAETLVTLDVGLVVAVLGAFASFFGGLLVVAAHREYSRDDRFLRLILTWDGHLVWERVLFQPAPVTVGESDDCSIQVAIGGLARHTLLQPQARETYLLDVPDGVLGQLSVAGHTKDVRGLDGAVAIGRGDAGVLQFENDLALAFQFTGAASGVLSVGGSGRDRGLLISFAGVAAVALLAVTSLLAQRHALRRGADEDLAAKTPATIELALEDDTTSDAIQPEGDEEDTTGKKAAGEEGKFGDPDKTRPSKTAQRDGPLRDKIDVRKLGIAKVLGGQQAHPGALGTVLAGETGTLQTKLAAAMAGDGAEVEIGEGAEGMGFRDIGKGGGGTTCGRVRGNSPLDTGGGIGRKADIGMGHKKPKQVPPVNLDHLGATGGCDRGDIEKAVRSRAATIRACYETQLLPQPDLGGKMTLRWTISGDGTVTNARLIEDGVGNDRVGDCVLRAIHRARFVALEAGTCVVQWPFLFLSGQ
jgi:hypothetical protein